MKKILAFMVFIVIFLTLYSTNPTSSDFKTFAQQYARSEVQKSGVPENGFIQMVTGGISDFVVSYAIDSTLQQQDYYLFSIYTVGGINKEYKFLGIFRKFIPLEG